MVNMVRILLYDGWNSKVSLGSLIPEYEKLRFWSDNVESIYFVINDYHEREAKIITNDWMWRGPRILKRDGIMWKWCAGRITWGNSWRESVPSQPLPTPTPTSTPSQNVAAVDVVSPIHWRCHGCTNTTMIELSQSVYIL